MNNFKEKYISNGDKVILFNEKSTPKYFRTFQTLFFTKKIENAPAGTTLRNGDSILNQDRNRDLIPFQINKEYKKQDIYQLMDVPLSQQRGKWDKGYCCQDGYHYVFANVGMAGNGYEGNSSNSYDYNNRFNNEGDLEWEAANGSKMSWPSIINILKSEPLIFIRDQVTTKDYWKFLGQGKAIESKEQKSKPVYVKWRIDKFEKSISISLAKSGIKNQQKKIFEIQNKMQLRQLEKFIKMDQILEAVNFCALLYQEDYPNMNLKDWFDLVEKYRN